MDKKIIISEQELFNLILNCSTEIQKLGDTGLVNKTEVILNKIKETISDDTNETDIIGIFK